MAVKKATKPAGELDSMSVADLKKSGAALGIDGASKMTKADLISAIGELQAANREAAKKEKEDRRAAKDAAREERRARNNKEQADSGDEGGSSVSSEDNQDSNNDRNDRNDRHDRGRSEEHTSELQSH